MGQRVKDLTGQRFGEWLVLSRAGVDPVSRQATWSCRCSCGTEKVVRGGTLRQGLSATCGECLDRSALRTTHGYGRSRAYGVWRQMHQRCENPENKKFKDYGGRGISVCGRWLDIQSFVEDMGEPPEGMTLDRIDVDGNYEPSNCRWATQKEQARNARSNILLTFDGETKCLGEWAEDLGINYGTLYARIKKGWSTEKSLTTSVRR